MSHGFFVYDRQGPGVCQTNGAHIYIGANFVRVILARTKHLRQSLKLGMDFKADGGARGHGLMLAPEAFTREGSQRACR